MIWLTTACGVCCCYFETEEIPLYLYKGVMCAYRQNQEVIGAHTVNQETMEEIAININNDENQKKNP